MEVNIFRFCMAPFGTFGSMTLPSGHSVYTAERAWNNNEKFVSCIPDGVYDCKVSRYETGGYDAPLLFDVPGRSEIFIHKANRPTEVMGCIAVGMRLGAIAGDWAVLNSGDAFLALMREVKSNKFSLIITSIGNICRIKEKQ